MIKRYTRKKLEINKKEVNRKIEKLTERKKKILCGTCSPNCSGSSSPGTTCDAPCAYYKDENCTPDCTGFNNSLDCGGV